MYIETDLQDGHQPKEVRMANTKNVTLTLHVEPAEKESSLSTAERMYRLIAKRCM